MWKVKFLGVVFLLILFVVEAESFWARHRRRRFIPPCSPRACKVSSWLVWSPCTHQCGTSGIQTRTRKKTVLESCGGSCPFVLKETRSCNRVKCPPNSGTPTGKSYVILDYRDITECVVYSVIKLNSRLFALANSTHI